MASDMTSEERGELIAAIADVLQDSAWGIATADARTHTAALLVARIEWLLRQLGWVPPAKTGRIHDRIHDWCTDMAKLPDHHISRDTLNSQMAELGQILRDE